MYVQHKKYVLEKNGKKIIRLIIFSRAKNKIIKKVNYSETRK